MVVAATFDMRQSFIARCRVVKKGVPFLERGAEPINTDGRSR